MSIRFDSDSRIFVLETAHTSYHMKVMRWDIFCTCIMVKKSVQAI